MTKFMKLAALPVLALSLAACATTAPDTSETFVTETVTSEGVVFGGALMLPTQNIVQNASAADNLTTLVSLVQQAELVDTLSGPGPFTVFAPTDTAFSYVPAETIDTLTQDENRAVLQNVLTYHVVPGRITSTDLVAAIEANGGSHSATTASGEVLRFRIIGGDVKVLDANGNLATVTTPDLIQSNGVVHVINSVLLPQ